MQSWSKSGQENEYDIIINISTVISRPTTLDTIVEFKSSSAQNELDSLAEVIYKMNWWHSNVTKEL